MGGFWLGDRNFNVVAGVWFKCCLLLNVHECIILYYISFIYILYFFMHVFMYFQNFELQSQLGLLLVLFLTEFGLQILQSSWHASGSGCSIELAFADTRWLFESQRATRRIL